MVRVHSLAILLMSAISLLSTWAPVAAADVSGLYLHEVEEQVGALHVVETKTGELTGRFELHALDSEGEIEVWVADLEGAANGDQVYIRMVRIVAGLFGSYSLSGQLNGQQLELTWEGGSGVFQRADIQARNRAIHELGERGRSIAADLAESRARAATRHAPPPFSQSLTAYGTAKLTLQELKEQMPELRSRLAAGRAEYTERSQRRRKLLARLSGLRAMNANWEVRYKVQDELRDTESSMRDLANAAADIRLQLARTISQQTRNLDAVREVCSVFEGASNEPHFCDGAAELEGEYKALSRDLKDQFDAWRELVGQR